VTRRSRSCDASVTQAFIPFRLVLDTWQVQTQRPLDERVCRVWGGGGTVRRCVLKLEAGELAIDVIELRVIPQRFERGCRLPAHGTLTVDAGSDDAWNALQELAQSRAAVVLERPGAAALEMRLRGFAATRVARCADGSVTPSTVTLSWHAP
jgi:hypothetical protein